MSRERAVSFIEFRRKLTNPLLLEEIQLLCTKWGGISSQDVIFRIICDGIMLERKKRKEIDEISKYK